jgi:4-amino-4-deoxy-L-arabinose transferase-like glycosyltransferase
VPAWLGVILIGQTALGLVLQNGPFQDEATFIYAGRQYVEALAGGPPVSEPYARYFAGLPYLQPFALGALSLLGGLEAARALSTVLLLGVTVAVFVLTRLLLDERSALVAAAIFAVQAPVLFLSRIATYDAGSLVLLSFAAVLAVAAPRQTTGRGLDLAAGAALLTAGALLVKYSALMFVPVIVALLVVEAWRSAGPRRVAALVATMVAVWLGLTVIAVVFFRGSLATDVWNGLSFSVEVKRLGTANLERLLGERFLELVPGLAILALVGALVLVGQRPWLVVVLGGGFLIAPLYHLVRGEVVSLHKHVAYGAVFAAPLAGYALARWWGDRRAVALGVRRGSTVVMLGLLALNGMNGARLLYSEWPDGRAVAELVRGELTPTSRVLAEEYEIPRLAANGLLPDRNWVSTEWTGPTYAWPYPASRDGARGAAAMREAIEDGWFDVIALRYGPTEEIAKQLAPIIRQSGHYREIASIPYRTRFGEGRYDVWKRSS